MTNELKKIEEKIQSKRYVRFEFFGYAPIDLAIQLHMTGKKCNHNMVGHDMIPYQEYKGKYKYLTELKNGKRNKIK